MTELLAIAKKHFGIETLATQNSDSLDFHDVAVWSISAAISEAYAKGHNGSDAPRGFVEHVAEEYFGIETLATQNSDSLDFHNVAVWEIKKALKAAYEA